MQATDRTQKQLYTVLEQKATTVGQGTLMGSDHIYVLPGEKEKEKWPVGIAERKRYVKAFEIRF